MFKVRHLSGTLKRTRRWRHRILWMLILLLIAAVPTGYYLTRPQRLGRFFAGILQEATGTNVIVRQAFLSYSWRIELEEVSLHVPGSTGPGGRLFEADRLIIQPQLAPLLVGKLRIGSLQMMRPTVYLTEDVDLNTFTFQMLSAAVEDPDAAAGDSPFSGHLPGILVRNGQMVFAQMRDGKYSQQDAMKLEGQITELRDDPGTYGFVLRRHVTVTEPGQKLSGQFNVQKRMFAVELERFSFDRPERNFMPHVLGQWWDKLDPKGVLPVVRVSYSPQDDWQANIEFESGQVNLPINLDFADGDAPGDAHPPLRMTEVTGRFDIEAGQVYLRNLSGLIKGVRYSISGKLDDLEADSPFTLSAVTEPFTIPQDPRFVLGLPPEVIKYLGQFKPSGMFAAQATVERTVRGGPIRYDGTLELLDARGAFFRVPYPLSQLTGEIRFTSEKIEVLDLRGHGPSGGRITVNGTILSPGRNPQVDLVVWATDISLDEQLRTALEMKHKAVYDVLLHRPKHQRLVELGLLRSRVVKRQTATETVNTKDSPLFDLGGIVNVKVALSRQPDEKLRVVTTVEPQSARFLFEHWPYPLEATGGRIIMARQGTTLDNVTVRGPTGAQAVIGGTLDRVVRDKPLVPHIAIKQGLLPIDDLLLTTIGTPQNRWIKQLHMAGDLLTSGRIDGEVNGDVDFNLQLTFADNTTVTPFAGQLQLDGFSGSATLRRKSIVLEQVAARHDDMTLRIDGSARWDGPTPAYDLLFDATDVPLQEKVLSLIPPDSDAHKKLLDVTRRYRPDGRADVQLQLRGEVGAKPDSYQMTMLPRSMAFDLAGQRIELNALSGKVLLNPNIIELDGLSGNFADGSFDASGFLEHVGRHDTAINFSAQADRIGPTTRALLPAAVKKGIDTLNLDGGYRVRDGRLVYRPQTAAGLRMEFEGQVDLIQGSVTFGIPITDLDGTMQVHVKDYVESPWPWIDLSLHAAQLRAADRLIKPFAMKLITASQPDWLELQECLGDMYGGVLVGNGALQLGSQGSYRVDLKIHDVEADAFLNPKPDTEDDSAAPAQMKRFAWSRKGKPKEPGVLSASLSLEAPYADDALRYGRGALTIRDAQLYDAPLPLALLQAINLSFPTSQSFDRTAVRYMIDGNTVVLDSLRFESPSLAIEGSGEMDWTTLEVKLDMITRNPAAPDLGPLNDMLNVFKDELVTLRVTGTLNHPKAKLMPLAGISESWNDIFGTNRTQVRKAGEIASH